MSLPYSSKLPAIGDAKDLVTGSNARNSSQFRDTTAKEIPILLRQNSDGELLDKDIQLLIQKVSRCFISALQQDSKPSWDHLYEVLDIVKPYSQFLQGATQINHYVERVCSHAKHGGEVPDEVVQALNDVFRNDVIKLYVSGDFVERKIKFPGAADIASYAGYVWQPNANLPRGVRIPRGKPVITAGETYILEHPNDELKHFNPKPLCMEDLKQSLPAVVRELVKREAAFGCSLGMTEAALDINLPQTFIPTPPSTPRKSPSLPIIRPPVLESSRENLIEQEGKKEKVFKTGREIVELFVKGRFMGEMKFAYLNLAPSQRYDPYNLIEVPKEKINPEHFVISSHSILHVQANRPSESQPLAEWYKEACQFQAISKIGFFKNFLLSKMFRKWKVIKKFSHFLKVEAGLERALIHTVPSFGSALLRVSGLLQDLSKITFLPFETNECYTLEEFEDLSFKTLDTGRNYVKRFFDYCQMIVDKTQENCFDYLHYCQAQVSRHNHNYRESLTLSKKKRVTRQHNLRLARDEVRCLGTFTALVDQIIAANLLYLAQSNVCRFVDSTMPGPLPERDGLFCAKLVFNETNKLVLSPSSNQFTHAVLATLHNVLSSICSLSHAMKLSSVGESSKAREVGEEEVYPDTELKVDAIMGNQEPKNQPSGFADACGLQTDEQQSPDFQTVLNTRTDAEVDEDLSMMETELTSAREVSGESAEGLCFRQEKGGGLLVEGHQFQQYGLIHCSPLKREKLEVTLFHNEEIVSAVKQHSSMIQSAVEEIEQFCNEHSWLTEIHAFVAQWEEKNLESWRGQPTAKIEIQLNQIRAWSDQVLNIIKSFVTTNGILFVDCHGVQDCIIPGLNNIFKQLVKMVGDDVLKLSEEVLDLVEELSQSLKEQKTDIQGFAAFTEQLTKIKEHVPGLKKKVEYIKNLYEVIRSSYRQLTPEEEILEEKVWATWEGFQFSLQEASDFVQLNTEQVVERIVEALKSLELEAAELGRKATSGDFLNPNEKPAHILGLMRQLQDRFSVVRTRLYEIGKCQEIITCKPYNMSFIQTLQQNMNVRHQLWKYCEVSSHSIREWLMTIFRKMNVKKAIEKVNEWITVGNNFKKSLPANDEVLAMWLDQLEEFSQDLPFLLQLSSDALKQRHWRALYIGMGQEFDATMQFTVATLLSFNLARYKDLISNICASSAAEYALEIQLQSLTKFWQEKDFKMAKHIPIMRPRFGASDGKTGKKKKSKVTEKGKLKSKPRTPVSAPDTSILIGEGELKCVIEDNSVTLHTILASPYVGELKPRVQTWIANLQQLEDIVDIWIDCQKKWLYLSNAFQEPKIKEELGAAERDKFREVDAKYREYVQVILRDPKVMSVLSKRRGEKGWRELQGEALRTLFLGLIRAEEELIQVVTSYMEQARVSFPRLYFLSDTDLLGLLAWSRNPKDLLLYVKKCFPGIVGLGFALPQDSGLRLNVALDTALNAHLLQVTAIEGALEEVVPLDKAIPSSPRPQRWLALIEENMRNTLAKCLFDCLDSSLRDVERSPLALIEKLVNAGQHSRQKSDVLQANRVSREELQRNPLLDHWLLRFPSQCVVTVNAVLWARDVSCALKSRNTASLTQIRSKLDVYILDLTTAIRKSLKLQRSDAVHKRLELLLGALLTGALHHRDVVVGLITEDACREDVFLWHSNPHHDMNITVLLTSSYEGYGDGRNNGRIPIERCYKYDLCAVKHLGASFEYGYEFLGPSSRLVVTPLTQRYLLTLTMAMRSFRCGTPLGASGSGKTETIIGLAKMLGRHLVLFNCCESLTSGILVQYLTGMVSSGSLGCFENADSLSSGLLSLFAQHLNNIRDSLLVLTNSSLVDVQQTKFVTKSYPKKVDGTVICDYHARLPPQIRYLTQLSHMFYMKHETVMIPLFMIPNVISQKAFVERKRRSSTSTLYATTEQEESSRPSSGEVQRLRRLSVSECRDIPELDYYENGLPDRFAYQKDSSKLPKSYLDTFQGRLRKSNDFGKFKMPWVGHLMFSDRLIPASRLYGCFMTMSPSYKTSVDLPENMKSVMRPVAMTAPNSVAVLEAWLICGGFNEAKTLSQKIDAFFKLICEQVSYQPQYNFDLRSMHSVVKIAGAQLRKELSQPRDVQTGSTVETPSSPGEGGQKVLVTEFRSSFLESFERRQTEENAVVHGLVAHFGGRLVGEDKDVMSRVVDCVFLHSVLMAADNREEPLLGNEIKEHFQASGFQVRQDMIEKVLQLHRSLVANGSAILIGRPGSGKSSVYRTLATAINNLHNKEVETKTEKKTEKSSESVARSSSKAQMTPSSQGAGTVEEVKGPSWPRVETTVVFPKALTCHELYGHRDNETQLWKDGLVSKYLRDAVTTNDTLQELAKSQSAEKHCHMRSVTPPLSRIEKWLVMDGTMDVTWMDNMGALLDSTRKLCLENGETVALADTVSMLFEVSELCHVTPSIVTRCGVVHCAEEMVGWKALFRTWIKGAYTRWDISKRGLGIISSLVDHVMDTSLNFLRDSCCSVLTADYGSVTSPPQAARGIHEVQTLLRLLSAIFDRHILREEEDARMQIVSQQTKRQSISNSSSRTSSGIAASDTSKVINTFAFAYIWAFGGGLHERYAAVFDEHARQLLSSGPYPLTIPQEGSVYDYFLDFNKGQLVKWQDRPGAEIKTLASSYTVVPEVDRYLFLMDLMISINESVLLVGKPGCGKTSLVQNLIGPRHSYTRVCMSRGFTSKLLQEAIEAKMLQIQRREINQFAAGQHTAAEGRLVSSLKTRLHLFFLDDLNCANTDSVTGAQPPLELFRQVLSQGSLYDKERHYFRQVQRIQFIAAAVPPGACGVGGGVTNYPISPRLTRLMTVLSFFSLPTDTLDVIYSSVLQSWLEEFPGYSLTHHKILAQAMAASMVKLHRMVCDELRPSPLYPHFLFTQHDLARVVQGMSLFTAKSRARPRPKVRRRAGASGEGATDPVGRGNGDERLAVSKSLPHLHAKDKRTENIGKGRSWPALTTGNSELGNFKTPAVISPLIRSLVRLWCHENTRVYGDRLLTEEQRFWFASVLHEQVEEYFCKENTGPLPVQVNKPPEFGQILKDIHGGALGMSPGITAPPPTAERPFDGITGDETLGDLSPPGGTVVVPTGERRESCVSGLSSESVETAGERESLDDTTDSVLDTENQIKDEVKEERETESPDNEDDQNDVLQGQNDVIDVAEEPQGNSNIPNSHRARIKVKFDDIHCDGYKSYSGPLITAEQLALPGEDLTEVVFCKHFNPSVSGTISSASEAASRSYVECSGGILEQGVERTLASYNAHAVSSPLFKKTVSFVAFREALHHAARLSRALATSGGHALLLSVTGYGRRTLTQLAAHAAGCKLTEVQSSPFHNQEDLRQQIKAACYISGLQGKPVVLFVPEGLSDASMDDISTLMAEGTCPGLYTSNELSMISSQLLPGGQRGARRTENQDIAQERFFRRVRANLHLVVCLKYTPFTTCDSPVLNKLYKFPTLVTRSCCVDVYRAWPHEALVSIADKIIDTKDEAFQHVPCGRAERETQMATICSIMAHVHLSARSMVEKLYGSKGLKLYSPVTYLEFVELFRKYCTRICTKEKEEITRLEKAIQRLDEAQCSITKMEEEIRSLEPVLANAQRDVKQWQESVEASQREYAAEKEKCKQQELEIERMQGPINILKKQAQAEFDRVSPMFAAAWKAINSLNVYDVEEIRSYRTPPELVTLVVNAICLLFNKEQTWEEGKLLLNKDNFFKDLEFYDVRGISDSLYRRLRTFINNPKFYPEVVKDGSAAASSLCMWVRAVYDYCLVVRALEPKRQQLKLAEEELQKAKSILGEMRIRCNAIKQELESKIQSYKDSVKHSRAVDKQIQGMENRKGRGSTLFSDMEMYSKSWQDTLKVCKRHMVTAPGDALVTAASVCYLGPVNPEGRAELFADWLRVCDGSYRDGYQGRLSLVSSMLRETDITRLQRRRTSEQVTMDTRSRPVTHESMRVSSVSGSVVPVREDISLQKVLSCPDELDDWKHADFPSDMQAVQNALMMRACCADRRRCWPLLLDPHNQAEMWVSALEEVVCSDSISGRSPSRVSARSSSRRSLRSAVSRTSTALDYESLVTEPGYADPTAYNTGPILQFTVTPFTDEQDQEDTEEMDDGFEADQEMSLTPETRQTETPFTIKSEQTSGSNFESKTERAMKEELAKAMGIQLEAPERPDTSGPTPDLELNEGDITVISADDPRIVGKLRSAVMDGVVVLVTNMERCRWNDRLDLLLARETVTDDEGNLQISIGRKQVQYNPSFRLYLSSSMPMSVFGEGLVPLPLSRTSVIDMAVSYEGVRDLLLIDTLALERPEYDGQERSLEGDVSLHKQQVTQAKEFILEKTLSLNSPLLKDTTMLQSVNQSKQILAMAEQRQEESELMHQQLLAKRSDYLPVAEHGALLFSVISELFRLHPYYHFRLETFLRLCHHTITDRCSGKKFSGSPAARAAELVDALTKNVYSRISWSLFLGDNKVFPFLVAMEKMLVEKLVTVEEWQLFIHRPKLSPSVREHSEETKSRPDWVSDKAWQELDDLQTLSAFSQVKDSILRSPEQWQEYFNLPPVLLGVAPCDSQLQNPFSVFQKALLWKTFRENQLHRITQDLVLYQLGASVSQPISYDIDQVYQITRNTTPVVFMLPSASVAREGRVTKIIDAETEVISLAKRKSLAKRLDILTLGNEHQMCQALTAVERAMRKGRWVLLTNCHLATEWSKAFLEHLQLLVALEESVAEQEGALAEDGRMSKAARSRQSQTSKLLTNDVHANFRLWLITRTDSGRPLPAILIQHGLKLACEAKGGFKEVLKDSCEVAVTSIAAKKGFSIVDTNTLTIKSPVPLPTIYSLALLHSLLHCRRKYGLMGFCLPYQWSPQDIIVASEGLCYLSRICPYNTPVNSPQAAALRYLLCNVVYGSHVENERDWDAVSSLTLSAICDRIIQRLVERPQGESEPVESYLDHVVDIPLEFLGLSEEASGINQLRLSRSLTNDLQRSRDVLQPPPSLEGEVASVVAEVASVLNKLLQNLQTPIAPTAPESPSAVSTFLRNEVEFYRTALGCAMTDLNLMLEACNGDISFTPDLFHAAFSLGHLRVPRKWSLLTRGAADVCLIDWLKEVQLQLQAVSEYVLPEPLQPHSYLLAAFVHQQAFLASLLLDHANRTMKAVHTLHFSLQVMDESFVPSSPPDQGVYLSGLVLENASWDSSKQCVSGLGATKCKLPLTWIKPVELTIEGSSHDDFDVDGIQIFSCPLFCRRCSTENAGISAIVTHLPLRTCLSKEILKQRRVQLTTQVNK